MKMRFGKRDEHHALGCAKSDAAKGHGWLFARLRYLRGVDRGVDRYVEPIASSADLERYL